jgi:hypothetical protein
MKKMKKSTVKKQPKQAGAYGTMGYNMHTPAKQGKSKALTRFKG